MAVNLRHGEVYMSNSNRSLGRDVNTVVKVVILIAFLVIILLTYFVSSWECVVGYVVLIGGFQLCVVMVAAALLVALKAVRPNRCSVSPTASLALFNLWLLLCGFVGNLLWTMIAWRHLYSRMDPYDAPGIDFIPFVLPGKWTIGPYGSLTAGTNWPEMCAIWLLITLAVWISTFVLHRWSKPMLLRRLSGTNGVARGASANV